MRALIAAQLLLRPYRLEDVHVPRHVGLSPVPVLLRALVVDRPVHPRLLLDQGFDLTGFLLRVFLLTDDMASVEGFHRPLTAFARFHLSPPVLSETAGGGNGNQEGSLDDVEFVNHCVVSFRFCFTCLL